MRLHVRTVGGAAAALLVAAALVSCERREPPAAPGEDEQAQTDVPQTATPWRAEGAALTLADAQGATLLVISCVSSPPRMTVAAPRLHEIGSEERLSFGVDDEPFVFVAQLGAPSGVQAEGAISNDLLDRLGRANTVTANYGAQYEGPHPAPSPQQAADFAAHCRDTAG